MKLRKKSLSLMMLFMILSGCNFFKATVPDIELCVDKMSLGASCGTNLSSKKRKLSEKQFDNMRFGRISISSEDYAKLKRFIQDVCTINPDACDYEYKMTGVKIENAFQWQ